MLLKKISKSSAVQNFIGSALSLYLKFVWRTLKMDYYILSDGFTQSYALNAEATINNLQAALKDIHQFKSSKAELDKFILSNPSHIICFWHGRHLLVPFLQPDLKRLNSNIQNPNNNNQANNFEYYTLISKHGDGAINVKVVEDLGINVIRGAGDHKRKGHSKGGMRAFMQLLDKLNEGKAVSFTADVPKVSRQAGEGIIKLAQKSQKPIVPISIYTKRFIEFNSWDKMHWPLPFSKGVCIIGSLLYTSDDNQLKSELVDNTKTFENQSKVNNKAYENKTYENETYKNKTGKLSKILNFQTELSEKII